MRGAYPAMQLAQAAPRRHAGRNREHVAMPEAPMPDAAAPQAAGHVNVLIVRAGISGIGAAWHLTQKRPGTRYVILETQETFGGTWWTHKYPGIRSDSDLYTFGYG